MVCIPRKPLQRPGCALSESGAAAAYRTSMAYKLHADPDATIDLETLQSKGMPCLPE